MGGVAIVGFGTFAFGVRAERKGRNTISAKKVVKYKPDKALKEEIGY
ncbi:MAG: HU family DNA-binding protein [Chlorobium sp.]|nr:HU family DNA-binding protein [Chlorobium sp.]